VPLTLLGLDIVTLVLCCPEQTTGVLLVTISEGTGFTFTDVFVNGLVQPLADAMTP
jgi:hypothetical protein